MKKILFITLLFSLLLGQDIIKPTSKELSYPHEQTIVIKQTIRFVPRDSLLITGNDTIVVAWIDTTFKQSVRTTVDWFDIDGKIPQWGKKVYSNNIYTPAQINGMINILNNNHQKMIDILE